MSILHQKHIRLICFHLKHTRNTQAFLVFITMVPYANVLCTNCTTHWTPIPEQRCVTFVCIAVNVVQLYDYLSPSLSYHSISVLCVALLLGSVYFSLFCSLIVRVLCSFLLNLLFFGYSIFENQHAFANKSVHKMMILVLWIHIIFVTLFSFSYFPHWLLHFELIVQMIYETECSTLTFKYAFHLTLLLLCTKDIIIDKFDISSACVWMFSLLLTKARFSERFSIDAATETQ